MDIGGVNCPSCELPFDKGKKRKLIDSECGHERCYSCMFKNEKCPICYSPKKEVGPSKAALEHRSLLLPKGSDICKSRALTEINK